MTAPLPSNEDSHVHVVDGEATAEARLLVCGGRDFMDRDFVFQTLDKVREHLRAHRGLDVVELAHGGARGADTMAHAWACERNVPFDVYLADWDSEGRAAGPRRNARMLEEFKPTHVVAFPGGRGTADMVTRARAAGVPVWEVERG